MRVLVLAKFSTLLLLIQHTQAAQYQDLPDEAKGEILHKLPLKGLAAMAQVNKESRDLSYKDLSERFCLSLLGRAPRILFW